MALGAQLLLLYLRNSGSISSDLKSLHDTVDLIYWILFWAMVLLNPAAKANDRSVGDMPPRWSGVLVVVATGLSAALFISLNYPAGPAYLPVVISLATVAIAFAVWRFATKNAADIGEARFPADAIKN